MKSLAVLALLILLPTHGWAVSGAPAATKPCAEPEQKQFDFWVGDWDLTWPGEKPGETGHGGNSIKRNMEGCVVEEHFTGGASMHLRGMSVSTFVPRAGKWKQTWVDNEGGYLDFVGEFKDGQMILSREALLLTARKSSNAWYGKTFLPKNWTGAGNPLKTAARIGKSCGPFTTREKNEKKRARSSPAGHGLAMHEG